LVLSPQVLLETYNVLTRKKRVAAHNAAAALRLLAQQEVAAPTAETALQAMVLSAAHGLSVWDALIVQTALQAGCDTLYTEDLQAGRRFGALEVVNPFALAAHESVPAFVESASPRAPGARRKAGPKPARHQV
jgi:predicted nucleic acid-binding protein